MTWRQRWCRLRHGHDLVLAYAGTVMLLRCTSCGFESPGMQTAIQRSA